jgi:hypothetical protein
MGLEGGFVENAPPLVRSRPFVSIEREQRGSLVPGEKR